MSVQILSRVLRNAPRREFASADKARDYKAAADALNAEAKENWGDPKWHREQAALIAERIDWGFKNENIVSSYMPTQNVASDERIVLEETRGMKVFWTARNGQIDQSQLRTEQWELPRETLGWHVSEFEDNWENDYAATVEKLVAYAGQRETAEINRRVFSVLQEAISVSSPYYEDASATGLTPQVLNPLLSEVADNPPASNADFSLPLSIVGRAAAIDQISDFPGFAPEALEEIRKRGRLGVYRAANIVRITNYVDDEGLPYIPEDEVFVLGGDFGRFVSYGSPKMRAWSENETAHFHHLQRRDVGVSVYRPQYVRRIKVA